jgi:membrane protein YqaA with SNARE-associated domain
MQESWLEVGALFVSAFISSTIAPGGSEAVLACMVAAGRYDVAELIIVATVGNTLGAMTTWGLGMLAEKKFPVATLLSKKKQQALGMVKSKGIWTLLFSWLPVIGDGVCFAGGWLKLPILPAIMMILIGKLARYVVVAWAFT